MGGRAERRRRRDERLSERLGGWRRVGALLLTMGLVAAVQADDTRAATKPAATPTAGTAPAKTTATAATAKNAAGKPAAAAKAASATKPAPPAADDDLLEFLGTVDSDTGDQDWIDYLSQTDIAKVAKGKKDD